jgi:hypothetical protein
MVPCDTVVNKYEKISETEYYLDAQTLAPDNFVMPDSFTIKQWNDEAYAGVTMRRRIFWQDKYFVDVFDVKSENDFKKEWTWHVDGKRITIGNETPDIISGNTPQKYMYEIRKQDGSATVKNTYKNDDVELDIYTKADGVSLIHAKGPNNPATNDICYLLERTYEKSFTFVNVIEAHKDGDGVIKYVEINNATVSVTQKDGIVKIFNY